MSMKHLFGVAQPKEENTGVTYIIGILEFDSHDIRRIETNGSLQEPF